MQYLEIISGPLIGAVIGYGTNWIAVKMLFHPLRPITIGKYTLPFTPGIIPRRKDALAQALGKAVGENLFTTNDIQEMLTEEKTKSSIVDGIAKQIEEVWNITIEELIAKFVNEDTLQNKKDDVAKVITQKVKEGIVSLDIGKLIAEGGSAVLKEKLQGGMFAFFLNDDFINSLAEPIGRAVENYIEEHGDEILYPMVTKQIDDVIKMDVETTVNLLGTDFNKIRTGIGAVYDVIVAENVEKILGNFDISGSVQKKVEEMDIADLEKLVLSVMKKEMDTLVNLGALIGGLIGILNIFI